MLSAETRVQVLHALKVIRTGLVGIDTHYGICKLLTNRLAENKVEISFFAVEELINTLAQSWPSHSGSSRFPVPCPYRKLPRRLHQDLRGCPAAWAFHNLPKWEGEYGDLRRELLDFLINELERANGTGNE